MRPELGVIVVISNWRATVHYTDCLWYVRAAHRNTPIPRRMKVVLCTRCRPTAEDVVAHTPAVDWYEYSPAPLAGVKVRTVDMDMEHAEDIAGRRELGIGKTPSRRNGHGGWSNV